MQENQYSKLVEKILNNLSGFQESKEEMIKQEKLDLLIKEFYQNENGATKQQRAHISALLSKQIQNGLSPKAKLKQDNKELLFKDQKNSQRSFIQENIKKLDQPEQKIKLNIVRNYPSLCEMNIPEMQKKYTFSRKDLHSFYVKYKALVELNAQDTVKGEFPVENGIDLETFRVGLIEKFASSSKNFLTTMFKTETIERMQWLQFLNIVNGVRSKKLEDRLSLFFSLMDRDSNGHLAYDEIYSICQEAFQRLTTSTNEEYLVMMASVLANQAFELVGLNKNEEIPIKSLVKAILEKENIFKQEIALILLMCCTEKEDQEEDQLQQQEQQQQQQSIFQVNGNPLLMLHPTWAIDGGEYELPVNDKKDTQRSSIDSQQQQDIECRIPKCIKKEIMQLKSKSQKQWQQKEQSGKVVISKELDEKLKRLVEEKRKVVHFEDDIVYEMEAKILKSIRNEVMI